MTTRDVYGRQIGTDTFVIRDGPIQMHTYYGAGPSPSADDRS
jgi:hypothetical protein